MGQTPTCKADAISAATPDLYECHITCVPCNGNKDLLEAVAKALHWKTSEIARDPVLGNVTFFYLTTHAAYRETIDAKMNKCVRVLIELGVIVVREKIEHIVHDVRYDK